VNRHGEVHATEHTVTAGLAFACQGYRCHHVVRKGEDYIRMVAFPGHDANGGTTPWVLKLCIGCYREHDPDAPLPPRRTVKP
jgi:hypothetical protein